MTSENAQRSWGRIALSVALVVMVILYLAADLLELRIGRWLVAPGAFAATLVCAVAYFRARTEIAPGVRLPFLIGAIGFALMAIAMLLALTEHWTEAVAGRIGVVGILVVGTSALWVLSAERKARKGQERK